MKQCTLKLGRNGTAFPGCKSLGEMQPVGLHVMH